MRFVFSMAIIVAIGSMAAGPIAKGQVVSNPFANPAPKKTVTIRQTQSDSQSSAALTILKSKQELEHALSELYRLENNLAERGRIWAETKDEWTDIRVIESNLGKAATHYAAGERHWEAGRYTNWQREWSQASDAMQRSRPQISRVERMIQIKRDR